MAIHRKREEAKPGARLLLESKEPVELPPAEVNPDGVTYEREEFSAHADELLALLASGVTAKPAPIVMSDSLFVIEGPKRTFWVRIWHLGDDRTKIDRLHISSSLPRTPGLRIPGISLG